MHARQPVRLAGLVWILLCLARLFGTILVGAVSIRLIFPRVRCIQ